MTADHKDELVGKFFSVDLPESERLRMLDEGEMVRSLIHFIKGHDHGTKELGRDPEEGDQKFALLEELFLSGETDHAMDLIRGLDDGFKNYDKFLVGGRIDHNGRPWPSEFCRKVEKKGSWTWDQQSQKCYELFALLLENRPPEVLIDHSLRSINSLNLGEDGAFGFFDKTKNFPDLLLISTDRNLSGLSGKCPKLKFLDFRRWQAHGDEKLDLSLLAGCDSVQEINLCYQENFSISDLPSLPNLKRLDLRRCWSLETIEGLPTLPLLRDLDLQGCSKLQELGDLSRFPHLRRLNLRDCPELEIPKDVQEMGIEEFLHDQDD